MKVLIDQHYLVKAIQNLEDLKKVLTIPSIDEIVTLCSNQYKSYVEYLPESWLSDELFAQLTDKLNNARSFEAVKRFVELGKLPKLTKEAKIALVKSINKAIRFFPDLPYDVWLEHAKGVEHSDQVPAAYRTQDVLIQLMETDVEIAPDLMTDTLIDAYINANETLNHIPEDRITLERVKKVLSKHSDERLTEEMMQGIVVDEELAGLLCGRADNFRFIPDPYRTRARLVAMVANEAKDDLTDEDISKLRSSGIPFVV